MEWLIGLVGGVIGGNAAAAPARDGGLGTRGNSLVGAAAGGAGGGIMSGLMNNGVDFSAVASQLVGGGAAGALVTAVAIMINNRMGGGHGDGEPSARRPD